MNAEMVKTGTMIADRIKGGTLTLGGLNNEHGVLIIVDKDGNNYGYFTANKYFHNRTKDKSLVYILDNYEEVIERLDKIRDDMK